MSTYYYVVCDKHRQRCDAASWSLGGIGALGHSFMLGRFVVDHRNCTIRVTTEHDHTALQYDNPHHNVLNPRDLRDKREAELLARAQNAETEVKKLRKLYGSPKQYKVRER